MKKLKLAPKTAKARSQAAYKALIKQRPELAKPKKSSAGSSILVGSDPILQALKRGGLPLTRENYLLFAYPTGLPEWNQELENELPEEIRQQLVPSSKTAPPRYSG